MKAILLAGGKGTRLRPLTIHTPKPIVPIFDRAFLHYQIDLLKQVPEIDEVILSLNYQPRRIEEIFGDGAGTGVRIRYVVEPSPLGTGGAVRFAAQGVTDTLVVFNGDVMTSVDVNRVARPASRAQGQGDHRLDPGGQSIGLRVGRNASRRRRQTIPRKAKRGRNDVQHDQRRDLRARAGHLRSHPERRVVFNRTSLLSLSGGASEAFVAYIDRGYWIDIGTPEKYAQVHHDMFDGRFVGGVFASADRHQPIVSPEARIEEGVRLEAPCFVDSGAHIKAGAVIEPYSVIGRGVVVSRKRRTSRAASSGPTRESVSMPASRAPSSRAIVTSAATSRSAAPAVLGDKTALTEFTRI